MTIAQALRTRTSLLTVEEAAGVIGVHKVSLYRSIKAKKIVVIHLGPGTIRIDPSVLADYIEKRTH